MKTKFTDLLPIFLMILTMTIGAAVWASSEHLNIRDWTAEQDFVTKKELKEVFRDTYTKREEFAQMKEKLEYLEKINTKDHEKLEALLDKIDKKLDKLQGNARNIDFRRNRGIEE